MLFVLIANCCGRNERIGGINWRKIILSGAIGIYYGSFTLLGLSQEIYSGFTGMIDIFFIITINWWFS